MFIETKTKLYIYRTHDVCNKYTGNSYSLRTCKVFEKLGACGNRHDRCMSGI